MSPKADPRRLILSGLGALAITSCFVGLGALIWGQQDIAKMAMTALLAVAFTIVIWIVFGVKYQ